MMSKGGVPVRTTVCATLPPGNGTTDDSARIQAAIDSCPANQVVTLGAGTFVVNSPVIIHSSITMRGAGAGITILNKKNGAGGRTTTTASGSLFMPQDPLPSFDGNPILVVGPSQFTGPDNTTSQNLSVDGQQGASSVTVANASSFAAGQIVILDERSGASWHSEPPGYPSNAQVWSGDRVAWQMHLPWQQFVDDSGNANSNGPYDTTPGVLPGAMAGFPI